MSQNWLSNAIQWGLFQQKNSLSAKCGYQFIYHRYIVKFSAETYRKTPQLEPDESGFFGVNLYKKLVFCREVRRIKLAEILGATSKILSNSCESWNFLVVAVFRKPSDCTYLIEVGLERRLACASIDLLDRLSTAGASLRKILNQRRSRRLENMHSVTWKVCGIMPDYKQARFGQDKKRFKGRNSTGRIFLAHSKHSLTWMSHVL